MSKKKPPTTIEECNAEMELTQKKIRQYENRNKMLDRKLAIEKRKERNHRLCSRGGYLESLVPALIDMSEQEARDFLYTAVFSDKAQEFLRKWKVRLDHLLSKEEEVVVSVSLLSYQ